MLDTTRAREYVKSFNFTRLFIEELGWDRHANRLNIPIDGQVFNLTALAQKKGMVAFSCDPRTDGEIPDHATRCKIESILSETVKCSPKISRKSSRASTRLITVWSALIS